MYKPGTNEPECIWVRPDKLGNPFLRKVRPISGTEKRHTRIKEVLYRRSSEEDTP